MHAMEETYRLGINREKVIAKLREVADLLEADRACVRTVSTGENFTGEWTETFLNLTLHVKVPEKDLQS